MKKIVYSTLFFAGMFLTTACSDYLEVGSPSIVDSDFVFSNPTTARAALDGAYEQWRDCAQNKVFGDGLFYAADIAGSDIERHPESFSNQLGRHYPECLYQNGTYAGSYGLTSYLKENDIYASLYSVVSKANAVITSMENASNFESIINGGQSEMGQMYGEAIAMRATAYRELCKNFGDVPYVGVYGVVPKGLVSRDSIYDVCIEDLQKVEPLMYTIGSIPGIAAANKNYFSKTYVQALIGRMCLDAAGYQTRRGDIKRVNGKGESMTFENKGKENNGATYGRRSDWQNLYTIAKKYYEALLADPGNAQFHLTDPRGASDKSGRTFNNPYQYFFEQMHMDDAIYADESIYEYPMQQGGGNDGRPYSFGRPSSGGSKAAYPCKSYGQGRINPAYFYGIFDPNDMRRDVSITMTGSNGKMCIRDRDCAQNKVFGDGLFYAADIAGSDIERHPESFSNQLGRHYPECLYQNGTYASSYGLTSYLKENDIYASLYAVVSKANAVITSMENAENFESIINGGQSEMGQMYGEAVAMRATAYRELCKNFGDVPYVGVYGVVPKGLVSRDSIYDVCIEDLQKVEPLMYTIGSIPGIAAANKNYFSKTYVQALIGRMCLDAAGYQTRRGDIKRVNGKGESMTFETKGKENNGATYGRRSDWQDLYSIAKKYYEALLADPGNALFHLTDPRGASDKSGRTFNNPYQYFFEQMHMDDAIYADESIYEYPMQQGGGNDGRPYSFGRPSSGGSKAAYPCKSYGQGRINPAYFYGVFDPNDMRRDVSITMTGSNGKGVEKLIPFVPNSKAEGGGLTLNKWDENRQANPWVAAQRKSCINGPYMRMSEVYLGYAEVCAALGDVVTRCV